MKPFSGAMENNLFDLFTQKADGNGSIVKPAGFELIKRTYQREIDKVIDYFHSRIYTVKSNHLLCRLLTTGSVSFNYDLPRYMEAAYTRSPFVARHFQMTSDISYGKIHEGIFYGPDHSEIILSVEDDFDYIEGSKNWKNLQPVKVLKHNGSDIGMTLPKGNKASTSEGLIVISVNIPMLLLQYRGFILQEKAKILNGAVSQLSDAHFVHMYVLPGMLKSHFDIVLMNRLKNLYYGAPMTEMLIKLPFSIVDYRDKIDRCLEEIVIRLKNRNIDYQYALKTIPTVEAEDMQEALLMPDLAPTRQVWWAMLLARLSDMKFLIDICGEEGVRRNRSMVNKLKIDIRYIKRDSVLEGMLPADMRYDIDEIFTEILAL
jgi:hypothetical protein